MPAIAANLAALIVFKVVLDVSYVVVIPATNYYALQPALLDPVRVVESYLLLIGVGAAAPQARRLADIFCWLLLLLAYVPMLTIYAVRPEPRLFMYATAAFWLAVVLLVRLSDGRVPKILSPRLRMPRRSIRRLYTSLYVAMAAVAIGVLFAYTGTAVFSRLAADTNLAHAYDARAAFLVSGVPLKGYYFHWLAMAFDPIFFILAIRRRMWVAVAAIFGLQLLVAGVVGQRTYFFALPFVALVALLVRQKHAIFAVTSGFALVVLVNFVAYLAFGMTTPFLLFTARFLLDSAQLAFYYFDFFTRHGPVPFAYLLQFFLKVPNPFGYPYDRDPALLIGLTYFHQPSAVAVAGAVADAVMNFGYFGLGLWAIFLALLIRWADAVARRVPVTLGVSAVAMAAVALSQTFTVRVLVTTGFLWVLLVLFLLNAEEEAAPVEEKRPAVEPALKVRAPSV